MTAKELIEQLQGMPQDATVSFNVKGGYTLHGTCDESHSVASVEKEGDTIVLQA